jgi:hypothetical protein
VRSPAKHRIRLAAIILVPRSARLDSSPHKLSTAWVGHRLAAPCLIERIFDLTFELLQKLQSVDTYLRFKRINVTGDKKADELLYCVQNRLVHYRNSSRVYAGPNMSLIKGRLLDARYPIWQKLLLSIMPGPMRQMCGNHINAES